jgi:hypothetical protein
MNLDNINFADLETKGFLVIQNFLNAQEIIEIMNTHTEIMDRYYNIGSINKNYPVLRAAIPVSIINKAKLILSALNQKTNLKTNKIPVRERIVDYLDNSLIKFGWHQDHENYFKWQNAYNDLNFWVAVNKVKNNESGLDVIPHDKLADKIPVLFKEHILGKGAKYLRSATDNNTFVDDTETGELLVLPINLEAIKETPSVSSGDLLLLRGDLIHRSQTRTIPRLSIGFRAVNTNQIITKEKFYNGSQKKQEMIKKNFESYKTLIEMYENKNSFSVSEYLK